MKRRFKELRNLIGCIIAIPAILLSIAVVEPSEFWPSFHSFFDDGIRSIYQEIIKE